MLLLFQLLLHPLIICFLKLQNKLSNINISFYHISNKISIIISDQVFLYFFSRTGIPSINNSPILLLISLILSYMLRRIVRTYSLYQSLVYLYHPEDKRVYLFGSYLIGFYYNFIEFCIKTFISVSILELNYINCFLYLLFYHFIEISLYYSKTNDSSNELFDITSNYIFKKLNE